MNVSRFEGLSTVDATRALLDKGWQQLGLGAAAFCFGKRGSGRVVKIVCGDRGQEAAVDLFAAHPEIAAFPRIYSRTKLAEDGCFAVEMERLREQPEDWQADPEEGGAVRFAPSQMYPGGAMDDALGAAAADLIRDTAATLGEERIDLHSANLMLRKDGTLVVVDPFYCQASWQVKGKVSGAVTESRVEARKLARAA